MNILDRALAVSALAVALAVPSLALAADMDPAKMTCKDFSAMDSAGMMKATDALHMASPDKGKKMDEAGMKAAMEATMKACKGHPDMKAMDAMMMK